MDNFKKLCDKWIKNKTELKFTSKIMFNGTKMFVKINQAPMKYTNAIKTLAGEIAVLALKIISQTFTFPVAKDDINNEQNRTRCFIEKRKAFYLDLLLDNGYESFMNTIKTDASVLQLHYEIRSLKVKTDKWYNWKGDVLTENGWVTPEGNMYKDRVSVACFAKQPNFVYNTHKNELRI